jgi:hypothetical protein
MNNVSQWLRPENGSAIQKIGLTGFAQKMGSAAECTARPKRIETGREAFSVRGPTQTNRFGRFDCPKWVGPLEMPLAPGPPRWRQGWAPAAPHGGTRYATAGGGCPWNHRQVIPSRHRGAWPGHRTAAGLLLAAAQAHAAA